MAAFDALTCTALYHEWKQRLLPGRIQAVLQPAEQALGLEIYAGGQRRYLYATIAAQMARAHLLAEKPRRGVDKPSPLLLLLRKYGRGARLTAVAQPRYERVLCLVCDHPEHGVTTLVFELMGSRSNVLLVAGAPDAYGWPQSHILDCLKRAGPDVNPLRTLLPGQDYTPPPPQSKLAPADLTSAQLAAWLQEEPTMPLARLLVARVLGLSPQAAREIEARSTRAGDATPAAVLEHVHALHAEAAQPGTASVAYEPPGGQVIAFAPYHLTHLPHAKQVEGISVALVAYYAGRNQAAADSYAGARRQAERELTQARRQVEKRKAALERQLAGAGDPQSPQQAGEWVLALATQIEPRQEWLEVDAGEAEPLRIRLDPMLSPPENAARYFQRARKARRAQQVVPPQLEEAETELAYLEQLQADLQLAENASEIEAVRTALVQAGYLRKAPRRAPVQPVAEPRRYFSADGYTILVGRNSRQNDHITFRVANSEDLWLHAHGAPGAHVVVRCGGQSISEQSLRQAAQLAAYYSGARGETSVPVLVTTRNHVRRTRRGRPGQVLVRQAETVHVPARLPELSEE